MRIGSILLCVLLVTSSLFAQKRFLVNPNSEVVPLTAEQSALMKLEALRHPGTYSSECATQFTFGYPPGLYPVSAGFNAYHKDVMGQWYIAPGRGGITPGEVPSPESRGR